MHKYSVPTALIAGFLVSAAPASAEVLARCGPSKGQAYFAGVGKSSGWTTDGISSGEMIFTSDAKGSVNLLFKDANGGITDAAANGAEIVPTRTNSKADEFTILVVYPTDGVTEVYNVVREGGAGRSLLWTSSKARSGGFLTKVGAYRSACD